MRAARADLIVLSVLVTVAMYFVRAERWQYLLEPLGHTLATRGRRAAAMTLELGLVDRSVHRRTVKPAAPTGELSARMTTSSRRRPRAR